jgi:hypothetical protein
MKQNHYGYSKSKSKVHPDDRDYQYYRDWGTKVLMMMKKKFHQGSKTKEKVGQELVMLMKKNG